jgi:hypothetical protein
VFLVDVVRNVALGLDANDWNLLMTGPAISQNFTNPLELAEVTDMMTALTAWRASWLETKGGDWQRSHDALQSHWPSPPSSAILARFLGVVSTQWPLVVVLDRAHGADKESCSTLIQHVFGPETADFCSATKGLLMIWSYRNDVELSESLSTLLSRGSASLGSGEETGAAVGTFWHTMELSNLTRTETDPWIKEFLHREESPEDRIHEWSDFVYECARGNPQQTWYILGILKSSGRLSRRDDTALPDLETSHSCSELYHRIVEQQDALVQNVVLTVIAIRAGDENAAVTQRVLDMVQQQSCASALLVAEEYGLLESIHGYYQLTSPELQEEVYSLLPVPKRLQLHLRIGRRLWKHSDLELSDESMSRGDAALLPFIAQQLQLGFALVEDAQERNVIALIHWYAGKNALKSSLFARASAHFEFAISVLQCEAAWSKEHYAINLALYSNAAEAYFCLGDYLNMGRMVETVLQNAVCFHDKLPAYTTLLFGRGAQFRHQEAVALALDLLNQLDEPLPSNPTKVQIAMEYVKVRWRMKGENDRYLASLPPAADSKKIAAMTMLNFIAAYSVGCSPECGVLAFLRLLRLTIVYGTTALSATAFSGYGFILSLMSGKVERGYRYGQIALAVLDQTESKAWLPRVYILVHGGLNLFVRPFRECAEPMLHAQRSALKTGDIECSTLAAALYLSLAFKPVKS